MDVSVIIVSYNTKELTLQCISSVYKYTTNVVFEIIVVDNNSKDGTVEAVRSIFPKVILIENEKNVGFGMANNQAISIALGKFVFLFNSDAYLISNALKEFVNFMKHPDNDKIGICGAELHSGDEHKIVSFGNFPSLIDTFSSIGFFVFYRKFFYTRLASGVFNYDDKVKEVDYITGADMFIRKEVIDHLGGFDEDFFMYFEETELSYRVKNAGYKSMLLPFIKIIHLEGKSSSSNDVFNYKKFERFLKGQSLFFKKCYGTRVELINRILFVMKLITHTILGKERGNFFKKVWIALVR